MKEKTLKNVKSSYKSLGEGYYACFIDHLTQAGVLYAKKELNERIKIFSAKADKVRGEVDLFNNEISTLPIMVVIYSWVQIIGKNNVLGEKYLSMMGQLIENNILPHAHSKSTPITLAEFSSLSPAIVDDIRCFEDWSIDKQEIMVEFYCEFSRWLSKQTFGLISPAVDYDKEITRHRKISFDTYVRFLIAHKPRERIMIKLFYLGGAVALEDVLSIKIEYIDFKNFTIRLGSEEVKFSPHLMNDLMRFIGDRRKGFVFRGRQNDRINHTVPYRALKTVAVKLGFGSDFTFKEFVRNH